MKHREIQSPFESSNVDFKVGERNFSLEAFNIGKAPEGGIISPGLMETGKAQEVVELFADEPQRLNAVLSGDFQTAVPYTFLGGDKGRSFGNYTTAEGQDEFKDIDLKLTDQPFTPPDWAKELWDFLAAKKKKKFSTDEVMACVRDLETDQSGNLVFTVGSGLYSESFNSNGSENARLNITEQEKNELVKTATPEQLQELLSRSEDLQKKYGSGSVRQIIHERYGHLPDFGEGLYNNSIGVAGMVLSERDQKFVFVNRGKNVSVNLGINCTASGAVKFDREALSRYGLPQALGQEMSRETNEELGFKAGSLLLGSMREKVKLECGFDEDDYDLVPVGFIRELPRGGKPECMFLIKFKGSAEDVVGKIMNNQNDEKKEIEGLVYSQPIAETAELLKQKQADAVIQHKGIANLMLALEYLKNNS